MPGADSLGLELQLTIFVLFDDIFVKTDQVLILGAAMCVVTGETGRPGATQAWTQAERLLDETIASVPPQSPALERLTEQLATARKRLERAEADQDPLSSE